MSFQPLRRRLAPFSEEEAPGIVTDLVTELEGDVDWISAGEVQSEAADVSVTLSVDGSPK